MAENKKNKPDPIVFSADHLRVFSLYLGIDFQDCEKLMKIYFEKRMLPSTPARISDWWHGIMGVRRSNIKHINDFFECLAKGEGEEFFKLLAIEEIEEKKSNKGKKKKQRTQATQENEADLPKIKSSKKRDWYNDWVNNSINDLKEDDRLKDTIKKIIEPCAAVRAFKECYRLPEKLEGLTLPEKMIDFYCHKYFYIYRINIDGNVLVRDVIRFGGHDRAMIFCKIFHYTKLESNVNELKNIRRFNGNVFFNSRGLYVSYVSETHSTDEGPQYGSIIWPRFEGNKYRLGLLTSITDITHHPASVPIYFCKAPIDDTVSIEDNDQIYEHVKRLKPKDFLDIATKLRLYNTIDIQQPSTDVSDGTNVAPFLKSPK